jgi:hypothetical protein
MKDAQATGEALSPQKGTSSTSRHQKFFTFFYGCESFLPSWIRIHADPDPQPLSEWSTLHT